MKNAKDLILERELEFYNLVLDLIRSSDQLIYIIEKSDLFKFHNEWIYLMDTIQSNKFNIKDNLLNNGFFLKQTEAEYYRNYKYTKYITISVNKIES